MVDLHKGQGVDIYLQMLKIMEMGGTEGLIQHLRRSLNKEPRIYFLIALIIFNS